MSALSDPDDGLSPRSPKAAAREGWITSLLTSPRFQAAIAKTPILRGFARRDGRELFGLVQGFVQSQALFSLVELRLLHRLRVGPLPPERLQDGTGIDLRRLTLLLQAGAAMGLLRRRRDGRFGLARKGAALLGVPGLEAMILHHGTLYRDLADPTAFLRGETDPDLARFWPYVFGAAGAADPEVAARYSALMTDSQAMVAADTLQMVSLRGVTHLADIGGGSGVFAAAAAKANPSMRCTVVDLPAVEPDATARIASDGLADRVTFHPASFRDDPLPADADAISLVRVLYDHADETVQALLSKVYDALPPGGRLVISEPMSGGADPDSVTDVYFAFYTLAMGTGRTRSAREIADLCAKAGFTGIRTPRAHRPFVTAIVTASKPG